MTRYDELGRSYSATRAPDPRIAAQIEAALGDARSVVNVGAGTGSYESGTTTWAVEPSEVMIAQRRPGSAPVVRASAESIPLPDDSADAVMALMTMHHWADLDAGIAEMRRIARRRLVVFTWDPAITTQFWLMREYLPAVAERDLEVGLPVDDLAERLGGARVIDVPIPADCVDGLLAAYWRRPEAFLDPVVRAGMSGLAVPGDEVLAPGLARLAADVESGAWAERHADLLERDELSCGYVLLVVDLESTAT